MGRPRETSPGSLNTSGEIGTVRGHLGGGKHPQGGLRTTRLRPAAPGRNRGGGKGLLLDPSYGGVQDMFEPVGGLMPRDIETDAMWYTAEKGIAMMSTSSPSAEIDKQRLCDKDEILSTLYRYVRGVDRRDYELVRGAYHADAVDDHGGYQGDVDGLIEWISRRHAVIEQSMHVVGQSLIDFLSVDVAVVESYCVCVQRYPAEAEETIRAWVGDAAVGPDQRLRVVMFSRYNDRFEKRDGTWRIARRVVVVEDVDSQLVEVRRASAVSREQVRGPADVIYELLRG